MSVPAPPEFAYGVSLYATLDSALFVKPLKGMEIGYIPIVTRQADN